MQPQHVHVALHHHGLPLAGDGLASLVEAVELLSLVEEGAVRGVDVFLAHAVRAGVQQPRAEARHLPAHGEPREDEPARQGVRAVGSGQPRLAQSLPRVALGVERAVAIAQAEKGDGPRGEPPGRQVLLGGTAGQGLAEASLRPLAGHAQPLALFQLGRLPRGEGAFLHGDAQPLPKEAYGRGEVCLLHAHDEVDGVAARPAAEAPPHALGGRDIERGVMVVVEGAQAHEARPAAAQRHVLPHHFLHAGGGLYLFYGFSLYHDSSFC